jgi:hypothetical protein
VSDRYSSYVPPDGSSRHGRSSTRRLRELDDPLAALAAGRVGAGDDLADVRHGRLGVVPTEQLWLWDIARPTVLPALVDR